MKTRASSARIVFAFSLLLFVFSRSFGQLVIQTGPDITPNDLVELLVGEGVAYDNVAFQGAAAARGVFSNGDSTLLGMKSGVFLTSGDGEDIPGPNSSSSISTNNGMPGHPSLNSITTGTTYDAAVLEFDFVAEEDTLVIRYVFGSEDYNESVGSLYNDVCGIFLSGLNPAGGYYADKNLAIVPGTTNTIVSANTVNNGFATSNTIPTGPCENCQYFSDNTFGLTLEYDGFTTVLVAWALIVPCEEYHLKIGVADVGDGIFDSGLFLAANGLKRPGITHEVRLVPPGLEEHMVEGVVGADVIFRLPSAAYAPLTLDLEISGTANPDPFPFGDFTEPIPSSVYFEAGSDSVVIHIQPSIDEIIEGLDFLNLAYSDTLGCGIRYDTVKLEILDYIEMTTLTSPNSIICEGQEITLWAVVFHGYPPYSFSWDPGGFASDTISVSPDTTTTYYVQVWDVVDTVVDSVKVVVFPHNYDVLGYSFEKANNPQLPWNVTGVIYDDSIALDVPTGTDLTSLVATFELEEGALAVVNNVGQVSGITPNDFTLPVVYSVFGMPSGCMKEWTVAVSLVTEAQASSNQSIAIFPNPAADQLMIRNARGYKLRILNELGSSLREVIINGDDQRIDVGSLPGGIYFLQFENSQAQFVRKVVIQKK